MTQSSKPLNLDFLDKIKIDGEPPDLEIVGGRLKCSSFQKGGHGECESPSETFEFASMTDSDLNDKIERLKQHLALRLPDGGAKLKISLEKFENEMAMRRSRSKKAFCQSEGSTGQFRFNVAVKGNRQPSNVKTSSDGEIPFATEVGCQLLDAKNGQSSMPRGAFSMELEIFKRRQPIFDSDCSAEKRKNVKTLAVDQGRVSPCQEDNEAVDQKHNSGNCVVSKMSIRPDGGGNHAIHCHELEQRSLDEKHRFDNAQSKNPSESKTNTPCDRSGRKVSLHTVRSEKSDTVPGGLIVYESNKTQLRSISEFSSPVGADGIKLSCSRRKENSSPSSSSSPVIDESLLGQFSFRSPREQYGGKTSSVKRRRIAAVGESPDNAMELSDDEESQKLKASALSMQTSNNYYPKREGLRSSLKRKEGLKIAYPSGSDPEAVEVQYSDLRHLAPYEFLNDTVIDFYIKYIQQHTEFLSIERREMFLFYNSFFFKKLFLGKQRAKGVDWFLKLRKWTKGINIFEKTYLLMPVHDSAHWSLAIICFQRLNSTTTTIQPYILHLDSMTTGHPSHDIFEVIRSYLEAEWKYTFQSPQSASESWNLSNDNAKRVQVPIQKNEWDCGLFLLYYIQQFVQKAPLPFSSSKLDGMFGRHWFKAEQASHLRFLIRDLLENIFNGKKDAPLEVVMEDLD